MKTIQQSLDFVCNALGDTFSASETKQIAYALAENVTGWPLAKLLTSKSTHLSVNQEKKIESFVAKIKNGEPLQYVLGNAEFYGLTFMVNPSTLIPRPETEELVEWILNDNALPAPKILDIGTGSGCIAITLKNQISSAEITAIDISAEALDTAAKNAISNNANVTFRQIDILREKDKLQKQYDIIVSNPPYICEEEKKDIASNVLDFEPHSALFVPNERPLIFYESIAQFAQSHLTENGRLYFEINQRFGQETVHLLEKIGFQNVELRKDFYGNDRMIRATHANKDIQ